jgi:ParB-like chromosome segregation protein Spo0J
MTTKPHDSKTKIEHVSIDKLIPYARNSRTHSDAQVAQIAASIKEFGFTNPVLVDGDGGIIAGHGRVMAAKSMKLDSVPCIRLDHLTEAQKKAYVIADNKLALNAGWNDQMLGLELADLQGLGFELELTGFNKDELASLMAPEPTEGHTDEDEVPSIPEQPKSQRGDVWLLGEHQLMCGDSTQADDLAKLIVDEFKGLEERAKNGDTRAANILGQENWYKSITRLLYRDFGSMAEMFSDQALLQSLRQAPDSAAPACWRNKANRSRPLPRWRRWMAAQAAAMRSSTTSSSTPSTATSSSTATAMVWLTR